MGIECYDRDMLNNIDDLSASNGSENEDDN